MVIIGINTRSPTIITLSFPYYTFPGINIPGVPISVIHSYDTSMEGIITPTFSFNTNPIAIPYL